MESHDRAVAVIAATVEKYYARKEPFRIYHGSTNSTRQSPYQRNLMVDTSGLSNIIRIKTESRTALCEPNVPMDALVKATVKHGLVPPVVPEFPGITVGGAYSGTGGESSSFRYGFFDRTINWVEMVLANGEIVKASSKDNAELFYGCASSFGTLGVTTLLEIQLIQAKAYVATTYHPVASMTRAQAEIQKATQDSTVDFLDGIMYSPTNGVICVGRLTNSISQSNDKVQRFTRRHDPWFYIHVQRLPQKPTTSITELIPLIDYLFRYDRGGFWVAKYAFKYFMVPFNRITRFMLDYYMHTRVMYHALHQSGFSSQYVIQDVAIPYEKAEEFMSYLHAQFNNYPVWLCPLKQDGEGTALVHRKTKANLPEMMLNFGVWGPGPRNRAAFVRWNRDFERKVHDLGGQKWLYAHTYYTEQEFDEIYDRDAYEALRNKYHATYLATVYDKVKVDVSAEKQVLETWKGWLLALFWSIWPLAGLYGVYKAYRGGDYLLSKASATERKTARAS